MQLRLAFDASPLRFCVLGSGSAGNAIVVSDGERSVLVDAGFSCRELERRMQYVDLDPRSVCGIVLTHEHGDHTRGAPRFSRRFQVPVHATRGTLSGVPLQPFSPAPVVLVAGRSCDVGPFTVRPFGVAHDAREPIGMVIGDQSGRQLGVAADIGERSDAAWELLADLDALVLETNHDLEMLMNGPYPWHLKHRIAGRNGHLSNDAAAEGVRELVGDRLRWLVLYHLSRTNNRPALAEAAVRDALSGVAEQVEICVSDQFAPTPWMEIGAEATGRLARAASG